MKWSFAWIALGVGLVLAAVLLAGGAMVPEAGAGLPLLTQLVVAEFGFFVTVIGAVTALRSLMAQFNITLAFAATACTLLAAGFLALGLRLWPGGSVLG